MEQTKAPETKAAASSIVKYEVTCDCYWNDRLWRMDDIAELPANVTPPKEYFSKL